MQARYALFSTFMFVFFCTTDGFGYVTGPPPAMNGILGNNVTCVECHSSFPLNRPNGGVSVTGLPGSAWTPGQAYPLSVTITGPATQRLFGFQLSAVSDATNQQAGTLTAGNARAKVICGLSTLAISMQEVSCTTAGAIQ